jgi:hypothetical protein
VQFVEIDQLSFSCFELNFALVVTFRLVESIEYDRIFIHVIQTCGGVTRHTSSSMHFCAGNCHHPAHNLSVSSRRNQQRKSQGSE